MLAACIAAVDRGAAVFPISDSTYYEIARIGQHRKRHDLREVIETMKSQEIRLIISSPYFDPRHAAFVSQETGARTIILAHQVGSRPGTDDYLSMCDYNARQLAAGLKGGPQ